MTINTVGYQIKADNALSLEEQKKQVLTANLILEEARSNSAVLQSLKDAVLASANDMAEMPGGRLPCPPKGARWMQYRVHWIYSSKRDDTVLVVMIGR